MPEPAAASTKDDDRRPGLDTREVGRPFVFAAAMATIFMAAIEGTIVATAMPTIVGRLGGFDLYSWVFTTYLLTQAVTIPIYGRLADLYGRKRVLLAGIGLFLAGSALCGLSSGMLALVIFRAIQGIGAGALVPVALTIVGDLYPAHERARMQGIMSGIWAAAAIAGPLVGAFLVDRFAWQMVFWVNLPLGLVAAAMLALALHETIASRRPRIDYAGSLLMTLGISLLMFALVQAATLSRTAIAVLVTLAGASLVALLAHEQRTPEPMLPLRLWRNRIIVGANLASFGIGAVLMGTTAFLPAYLQGVLDSTALIAGLTLTAMTVAWSAGATTAGRLMLLTSYRTGATAGGLFLILGSVMMIGLEPSRGIAWAVGGALLTGIGMGLVNNSFTVAVQSAVAWEERGIATSSSVFMRMIGQTVGTAVFGGILNSGIASRIAGGVDLANRLMEPAARQTLSAAEIGPLRQAIAEALHNVYLIDGVLAVLVLAATVGLPRRLSPLRQR